MILVHFTHLYITYVYNSTNKLNTQEVYDFVEEVEFDFLHGETATKGVDNGFAATARKINFDAETEAFFGDQDGGIIGTFFEDAECFEILVLVKIVTL